jgi:hypothetical protein
MGVLSTTDVSLPVTATFTDTSNVLIKNLNCDATVYVGAAVYIEDITFKAKNAIATSQSTSNVIGIAETKPTSTTCDVRVLGTTGELYTGLDVTKEYFLSDTTAGQITTTIPTISGHIWLKIGQPLTDKKFVVLKGQRVVRQ